MNKTALQDIQKTLNLIRNQIDAVDADTKCAALAKKMAKLETNTIIRTISVPRTKNHQTACSPT